MQATTQPTDITIERATSTIKITWGDGVSSDYPLRWLRANCPCATCKEVRSEATLATEMLTLNMSVPAEPSTEVARAELVGSYAIRLEWTDGHGAGIFAYSSLRSATDLEKLAPDGSPHLNFTF